MTTPRMSLWARFWQTLGRLLWPSERAPFPYHAQGFLLTEGEFRFYRALMRAVRGRFIVCPKVRLGMWAVTSKHLDFVLCRPSNMAVQLAIELDDITHRRPSRIARDRFVDRALTVAGVPIVRFPATGHYTPEAIAERIGESCPASEDPGPD